MKKALTNNLGLKLLSLAVSILLWVIVVNTENPVSSKTLTNIPVTVTNAEIVTNRGNTYQVLNEAKTNVTVTAKQSVLREIDAEDVRAIADMGKIDTATGLIPIEVSVPGFSGVEAVAVSQNIQVKIEMESTKSFPITPISHGTLRDGYEVGELTVDPKQIEISGPESVIDSIAKVVAEVDVSGLSKDQVIPAEMVLYDANGKVLDETLIQHNLGEEGISVNVSVYQTKSVPVNFDTSKIKPADGYVFEGISVEPSNVEVIGAKEDLKELESIEVPAEALEAVDLTKTVEQAIDISPYFPDWSKQSSDKTEVIVLVKIFITKEGTKTIEFPTGAITLVNVPKGYTVDFGNVSNVEIVLKGSKEMLGKVELEQGSVSINLVSIKEEGTYEVPLQITLQDGVQLEQEVKVQINLTKSTEE